MQQLYSCCSGLELLGIAYDYVERIKEESIGDALKVATEAKLTSILGKIATPAKSSVSDGKRIFWAFRRLQLALDCCCRLRVGERGVGTVRRPAVTGEPCRVRGPPSA